MDRRQGTAQQRREAGGAPSGGGSGGNGGNGNGGMQLTLAGIAPPRPATDRLFFAVYPDARTAAKIGRLTAHLARQHGLSGRLLTDERFHVTLYHLGDFDGLPHAAVERAQAAGQVAGQGATEHAPDVVELVFDRAGSFAGRRQKPPFVLLGDGAAVGGLMRLQRRLGLALNAAALPVDAAVRCRSHGMPHAALHAAQHAVPPVTPNFAPNFAPHVTLLYDDIRVAPHAVEPVAWTARELVLVRSLLGRGTHLPLARWPLP